MDSSLVNPTFQDVLLSIVPGGPGVGVRVYPDLRAAPNDGAALTSVIALALINAQNAIMVLQSQNAQLSVLLSESVRLPSRDESPSTLRDPERYRLSLAAVDELAARVTISAPAEANATGDDASDGASDDPIAQAFAAMTGACAESSTIADDSETGN